MKTVEITHAIGTLAFTPAAIASGMGMSKGDLDKLVNDKLAEGYDEVEVIPLKSNFNENAQIESVVNEYIFRKHIEDAPAPTARAKKE